MMNYNELSDVRKSKNIMVEDLARAIGYTSTGFKRAIDEGTFPISKVKDLCAALGITVTQFFEGGVGYDAGEEMPPTVASEAMPYYGAPVGKRGNEIDMIATLISHISWLEAEIDRLRAENERLTSK